MGDPLFEGVLKSGQSVTRKTNSPEVFDHSVKETKLKAGNAAWNDAFFGDAALAKTTFDPTAVPLLFDVDSQGGLTNIFYAINVPEWTESGGSFVVGEVYGGFSADGTHPDLPGITVGYSTDPDLTIEEAFSIDFETGEVTFLGASPFDGEQGSLVAQSSMMVGAEPPPPTEDLDR